MFPYLKLGGVGKYWWRLWIAIQRTFQVPWEGNADQNEGNKRKGRECTVNGTHGRNEALGTNN